MSFNVLDTVKSTFNRIASKASLGVRLSQQQSTYYCTLPQYWL